VARRDRQRESFGSVRQLPSGRWQARYTDPRNGRRIILEASPATPTFATEREANRALSVIEAEIVGGLWRDPALAKQPFEHWAERYLATTLNLRAKTRLNYRSTINRHLLPEFKGRAVAQIDTPAVEEFLARLHARGAALGTVQRVRAVLRNVLQTAVKGGAIRSNPCAGIKVARAKPQEPVFLTPDQVHRLAEEVARPPRPPRHPQRRYPEYRLLVLFAAYTGLRASELAALKVRRMSLLNQKRASLQVVEAMTEVGAREVEGGLALGDTKNNSHRRVGIPAFLVEELREHTAGLGPDDLVFRSPEGGPFRHKNFYNRHFRPAVARAGLPSRTRFHDLRHTYASLLIAQEAHAKVVQERLGHSSIRVTLDTYGHLLPSLHEDITERLDALGREVHSTAEGTITALR
jgi:integrase